MNLHDIQKVLQHCYNCQAESRPESAFRFGKIVGAKRKQVLANYPGSSNDQGNESDEIPANGRKKKKGKGKQQEDQERGNELEQNPYNRAKKKGKGRRWKEQLRGLLKINQSEETLTPDENGTEDHESQQALKLNEPGHLPQEPLIALSRSDDPRSTSILPCMLTMQIRLHNNQMTTLILETRHQPPQKPTQPCKTHLLPYNIHQMTIQL